MGAEDKSLALERTDSLVSETLSRIGVPERVHYAAGVLLDAADFESEQAYHRGRLARALSALFGFGTLAGLRVTCMVNQNPELEVKVAPGLALDRLGRLIEIRREQCLRIKRWLDQQESLPSNSADRAAVVAAVRGSPAELVFDVFARFAQCAHGKTPAFAAGPFNATDYVVPARLADAFELTLGIAATGTGNALRSPGNALPRLEDKLTELEGLAGDPAAREQKRREWVLDNVLSAWVDPDPAEPTRLAKLAEHPQVADWDKVLLARITVPVLQENPNSFPQLDPARLTDTSGTVDLADNSLRPLVFNPTAWRGLA